MDVQAALMRAIIDEPDEDAHRLVFADWLEDEGKREWAALIRSQCALARLMTAGDDPYVDPRRVSLGHLTPAVRREVLEPLTGLFDEAWLDAGEPDRPLFRWKVRRGFPEYLELWGDDLPAFVERAPVAFERAPLRDLVLRTYCSREGRPRYHVSTSTDEDVVRLLRLPGVARLRNLDLRGVSPYQTMRTRVRAQLLEDAKRLAGVRVWVSAQQANGFAHDDLRGVFGMDLRETESHFDNPNDDIPF